MSQNLCILEGRIISCVYANNKSSVSPYYIYNVHIDNINADINQPNISVIVRTTPPKEGADYRFYGQLKKDWRFGFTFESDVYVRPIPFDFEKVVDFLGSGLFKGIGKRRAQKIVSTLGSNCLTQIIADPTILHKVNGISEETILTIQETIIENLALQKIIMKLEEWKISIKVAKKIYKIYGDGAIQKITDNPYCLASSIKGIGYNKSDKIAQTLNITDKHEKRIKGTIEFALADIYLKKGSTFSNKSYIVEKTRKILFERDGYYIDKHIIEHHLEELVEKHVEDIENFTSDLGQVRQMNDRIYLERYYAYEKNIADSLMYLCNRSSLENIDSKKSYYIAKALLETEQYHIEKDGFTFSNTQKKFLLQVFENNVIALTGGPGTGKSTLIKAILMMYQKLNPTLGNFEFFDRVIMLAPTGRAAKRMAEITQLPASTIHLHLLTDHYDKYTQEEFEYPDPNYNLLQDHDVEGRPSRLFIIDEMSMVDIGLMQRFLKKTKIGDRIILVGDMDQLPSIGAGNVFADIIQSNIIPTVCLDRVYRQGKDSPILTLAQKVREGNASEEIAVQSDEVHWDKVIESDILKTIEKRIYTLLQTGSSFEDIQIICPFHRGEQGIKAINQHIQNLMLENTFDLKQDYQDTGLSNNIYKFYIGDRVIQLRNDSDKNLSNGDIGIIVGHRTAEENELDLESLVINFNGQQINFYEKELGHIDLAYAFSVHKSQGSEFKHVILPMAESFNALMNRNFVYTAVTRAKESLTVVGSVSGFIQATNRKQLPRFTFLRRLLQENQKAWWAE